MSGSCQRQQSMRRSAFQDHARFDTRDVTGGIEHDARIIIPSQQQKRLICQLGDFQNLLARQDLGYRILYGPPVVRAKYLFLGYQPGGRADSRRIDQLRSWPTECEYALNPLEL